MNAIAIKLMLATDDLASRFRSRLEDAARDEQGLTMVEYFIGLVGLATVILLISQWLGAHLFTWVQNWFSSTFGG